MSGAVHTPTPGPWEAGHECISGTVAVWAGDAMVAQVGGRRITADQSRIDARLIASAPELLEALEEAIETSDRLCAERGWVRVAEAEETLAKMRAAIARAKGETQ